jgi:sugar phosphate isomerase/epimerase
MISRRRLLQSFAAPALLEAAPKDPVVGFAFGNYGMKTFSTEQALRAIAAIGYDGAELCLIPGWPTDPAQLAAADRRALRSLLAETGLAAPALLDVLTIKPAPEKRAYNLERLKQDVDLANELAPANPPLFYTSLGGKSDDWESLKRPMADELHAWARIAEGAQVTVCFKPHADHAVNNAERAFWLLQQVGSPRDRRLYD